MQWIKLKYTQGTLKKNTTICFNWKLRSYLVINEEERKHERKANKIISRQEGRIILESQETSHKQSHRHNYKVALNEKPTDSPQWFFIRSSI